MKSVEFVIAGADSLELDGKLRVIFGDKLVGVSQAGNKVMVHLADSADDADTAQVGQIVGSYVPVPKPPKASVEDRLAALEKSVDELKGKIK